MGVISIFIVATCFVVAAKGQSMNPLQTAQQGMDPFDPHAMDQNLADYLLVPCYAINRTIFDETIFGVDLATINLGERQRFNKTTDGDGRYQLTFLPAGDSYKWFLDEVVKQVNPGFNATTKFYVVDQFTLRAKFLYEFQGGPTVMLTPQWNFRLGGYLEVTNGYTAQTSIVDRVQYVKAATSNSPLYLGACSDIAAGSTLGGCLNCPGALSDPDLASSSYNCG